MCQCKFAARAVSLSVLLLAWLVSACAGQLSQQRMHAMSPLTGPYSYLAAPSSHPSGRLVLADTGFPTSVNPLFSSTRFDMEVSPALWAAPVAFDEHFHAQPDQLTEVPLPENGDVQDGGKTILMHLRHDLHWSDGQPLVASDFVYWWRLNQNPDTGAITTTGYDQIASIETPDQFTVLLHMKQAYGPYLHYLPYAAPEHAWGQIKPIDLQNRQDIFQAPTVTDGPYKLALFANQQSYTLVPNPYYTSTTFHGPFLAQIVYRMYPTLDELTAAVRSGQVDVAEGYSEDALNSLSHLPEDMQVQTNSAAAYEHLDFNLAHPVLQDIKVRQAIELALDRCGMLRDVLHMPDCARLVNQVEPLPSLVYDETIHAPAYDPVQARNLLTAAGWLPNTEGNLYKQGQPFILHLVTTTNNIQRAAIAQSIQKDLQAVGIQVQVAFYDPGAFFGLYTRQGILATGAFDLAVFGYANNSDPDDEYEVFHSSQIPSQDSPDLGNYGRIADPIIDQALTEGRTTVPFAPRRQAYQRFLERLASQVYIIPLYTARDTLVARTSFRNIIGNPDTLRKNWNIADWWRAT